MADKNSAADVEYNDDGTKNPDYVAPKTDGEGEPNAKKLDKDGKEITDDKGGEGDGEDDAFDDTIDPAKPPEIPVRRSNLQNILNRKDKKIQKLESKLKEGDEGYVPPTDGEEEEEDDADLSEGAKKAINKKVESVVAPLLGKMASEADEKELSELISADPDVKKYVNHIKAYMAHDAYKGVSPTVIYHHLAFSSAKALGAKKKEAADLEAKQNKGGGNNIVQNERVGNLPTASEINDMSEEDFAKMEEEVLQGKYLKK